MSWCVKCHAGSEIHVPYKDGGGSTYCNQCGKITTDDSGFVDKNPIPVKANASIHPGKHRKDDNGNEGVAAEVAEVIAEAAHNQ